MRLFTLAFGAALGSLAVLAAATPVLAQPLEIVVPGDRPDLAQDPAPIVDTPRPSTIFSYNEALPFDFDFEPGEAAFDAQIFSGTVLAPNMVRARLLEANGASLAEHQLHCQAMHPSYELAGDTYLGPDGLPRPCVY